MLVQSFLLCAFVLNSWAAGPTKKLFHRDCKWSFVKNQQSELNTVTFQNCNIEFSDFEKSSLKYLTSSHSKWTLSNFKYADLRGSYWSDSICRECDFRGADLRESTFFNVDLSRSKIDLNTKLPFSRDEAWQKGMISAD